GAVRLDGLVALLRLFGDEGDDLVVGDFVAVPAFDAQVLDGGDHHAQRGNGFFVTLLHRGFQIFRNLLFECHARMVPARVVEGAQDVGAQGVGSPGRGEPRAWGAQDPSRVCVMVTANLSPNADNTPQRPPAGLEPGGRFRQWRPSPPHYVLSDVD